MRASAISSSLLALAVALGPLLLAAGPASAALPPFFTDALVASGLNTPRGIAFFPNGTLALVENAGRIAFVNGSTVTALHTMTDVNTGSERGLLGVAVDPDYPARPYLYVDYTAVGPPTAVRVARYTVGNASSGGPPTIDGTSRVVLLGDMPDAAFNHNGGTVRFGPDKLLYISVGDDADNCAAQNLSALKGKILRVKVDDSVDPANRITLAPPGNPFYNASDANASLVWAWGLRNPFRFDIDKVTGRLYIGDVGQNSWEEVDVSAGGENFGWPYREGDHNYRTTLCPGQAAFPVWTAPIYEYPNPGGASVIQTTLYRGVDYPSDSSFPPEFDGNSFFFDFYSGNLRVLRADPNGTGWALVPGVDTTNFATSMTFVTDMRVGPDGALYWISAATNQLRKVAYQSVPEILTSALPPGTVGDAYTANLTAAGNAPPYTWTVVNGSLPDGLTLSASSGQIAGAPTLASGFSFTVEVRSAVGRAGTKDLSIVVAEPVSIVPSALSDGVQYQSYLAPLAALGGRLPYTWTLEAGAPPPGFTLTLNSGHLSGVCPEFGAWTFTVRATDADGRFATREFTIRVVEEMRFETTLLPQALQGAWFEATLSASGGTPPYVWDISSLSALPPELALGGANGTVYGWPLAPGATSITFELRDSAGQFRSRSLDLVIAPPPGEAPLIATVTLPPATTEVPYAVVFQVAAGVPPFNWSVVAGSYPSGFSFDAANATLLGVTGAPGNYTFGLRVTDSYGRSDERNFALRVDPRVRQLGVTTASLPAAELGVPYGPVVLEALGVNHTLPLSWSSTSLPPGLTFSPNGRLEGKPTAAGAFLVAFVVTDASAQPLQAQAFLAVKVTQLSIIPPFGVPVLVAGNSVALPFLLDSPTGGVNWTVVAGVLPPGLRLDPSGVLLGAPTTPGNYSFKIRATHPLAPENFAELHVNLTVTQVHENPPPSGPSPAPGSSWPWVLLLLGAAAFTTAIGLRQRRRRLLQP